MYLFLECFTMFIFGIWQAQNAISVHSSMGLIKKYFGYTWIEIRNICNCHLFLIVNSDCKSSNTRIQHSKSSKSMSNDESVIYVLVSWVLHNVHFRKLASWKCDFCSFVNGSYYVNDFGYTCIEIKKISHTTYSSSSLQIIRLVIHEYHV